MEPTVADLECLLKELPSGVHRHVLDLRGPSDSAKCFKGLFDAMHWDPSKWTAGEEEGWFYDFQEWIRWPADYYVGINQRQYTFPANPFVGPAARKWRYGDPEWIYENSIRMYGNAISAA